MSYRKKDFSKFSKKNFKTQPDAPLEDRAPRNSGKPTRDYEINPSFQRRAFKDLSFNTFSIKVNPNEEAAYMADPYAILNSTNPIVDAIYPGNDNVSGSVIPQLANGSTSTFKGVPDSMQMIIKINYLFCYLNVNSNADHYTTEDSETRGRVNEKMMVPFREILNTISAEAYYDLPFFQWYCEGGYSSDSLLDVLLNYQAIIQAVATIPLKYRVIRGLEQHLKDMCYMNGASNLNAMYGYLKKAALINQFKGVSETLLYHYLDSYWYNQVSMLVALPSRKSNSMLDPLMDIVPEYEINTNLKVYADSTRAKTLIDFSNYSTIMTLIDEVIEHITPQYLLDLARSDVTYDGILAWGNLIMDDLGAIVTEMTQLTKDFADLIVAFKRMSRVGITEWKIGNFVTLDKLEENFSPKFNKLVFDIFRNSFTGSKNITYDAKTNKWDYADLWDKYLGIPSYDYKSGGCIMNFSTKTVDREDAPDSVVYPALYYGNSVNGQHGADADHQTQITVLTRDDSTYWINKFSGQIDHGDLACGYGRLAPITSFDDTNFLIPFIDLASLVDDAKKQSWLQATMIDVFGYESCLVAGTIDEDPVYNHMAKPDVLCFVDIELDDQTNAIETYVRQHSPFRVIKTTLVTQLGFATK